MAPSSYRPLESPLPSHPGLSTTKSSRSVPTVAPPIVSAGALSAISALLGAHRAGAETASPRLVAEAGSPRHSALLARRRGDTGAADFSLGPELGLSFLRPREQAQAPRRARERRKDSTTHDDLPPSPVGLPGGWHDSQTATSALLLPPPFLDEKSSAESFEGLLGTRFARETNAKARREARLYARDRPPGPAFPGSLLATASKLVSALGPPGGVDSGPMYRRWKEDPANEEPGTVRKERRRVERAEQGMKGYEVGQRIARKLADRLRRQQTDGIVESEPEQDEREAELMAEVVKESLTAATPMSFFGNTPSPLSPPLFAFPTPGLTDTQSSESPDPIPATPSAFPPKPSLRPIFDDAEPSPLPLTPEEPLRKTTIDEGYFAVRQRKKSRMQRLPKLSTAGLSYRGPKSSPVALTPTERVLSYTLSSVESHARAHADLLIWLLIGSPKTHVGLDQGFASIGGLVGILLHLVGFAFFVLVHTWALLVSLALTTRSIFFFLHWTFLNLTGRTDLSIVVKEYLALCRTEWDTVCAEDGVRLGVWSVGLGLFELMAVQAMSKERWLREGSGHLVLLNGDDNAAKAANDLPAAPLLRRRSTKRRSSNLELPGLTRHHSKRWSTEEDRGTSLLVTGGGDSILEGRILNDPFDALTFSPSFSPKEVPPNEEGEEDLPPLDLNGTLPGFTFSPSPQSFTAIQSSPPLKPIVEPSSATASLATLLARHVRLATASYGLHTYILAPPSPLFTPGVDHTTLPHRVFSHLGGVDHKTSQVLHVAIQKHYTGIPSTSEQADELYAPQFYLLRDDLHGEIICVVRGTQSLHDIRTDLEADMEAISLPSLNPTAGDEVFLVHAGILAAARRLLDPDNSPLFAKLKAALEETGYSLVFNGHSLGGAIASTLALLLGEYTPAGSSISSSSAEAPVHDQGRWTINSTSGLPVGRPLRAITFAHPASVGLTLAKRCAIGKDPLVVSVSLGSDVVCRMGIPQVREIRRALGRLAKNRRRWLGERKNGEHGQSEILGAWWKWKGLGGADVGLQEGSPEGREREAVENKAWKWRQEMEGDAEVSSLMAIPAGKCYHVDRLPAELEAQRRKQLEEDAAARGEDEEEDEPPLFGIYSVESPPHFYAMPLLESDLVQKHLPKEYLDAISSL